MHRGAWLVLALAACAPDYAYVPLTSATVGGAHVAADYRIPSEAPRGDLRLASYGIVDISSRVHVDSTEREPLRAMHLRATIINSSDRPWTFDTREQRVDLEGHGVSAPAFASASAGTRPPVVTIPAFGKRVIDLFFPLPTALQHAAALPAFDALWRLSASDRVISESAHHSSGFSSRRPTGTIRSPTTAVITTGARRTGTTHIIRATASPRFPRSISHTPSASARPRTRAAFDQGRRLRNFSAIARANAVCGS